jgi:1-acyl-sn-glycerol-3-phosphate acyltransferase
MMLWLRSALFNAWFYGSGVLCCLAAFPVCLFGPQAVVVLAQIWLRIALWGLRVFCGVYPVVSGRENLPPSGPVLIASQHQSAYDTLIWLLLVPRPCFVMKQELINIPVFGYMLLRAGMIAIDRNAGAAALRKMLGEAGRARDIGRQIIVFPEGTRAPFGAPLPPQPGIAAMARGLSLDVVPVATDSGRRWARKAFLKTPGPIHIVIGPAISHAQNRGEILAKISAHWHDCAAGG